LQTEREGRERVGDSGVERHFGRKEGTKGGEGVVGGSGMI